MTGSLQVKNNTYYVILNFKDEYGKRKQKWINTQLSSKSNNKRQAEQMLNVLIVEHIGKENITTSSQAMLSEYLLNWLERKKDKVELSTWESYDNYIRKHLAPYFEKRGITLETLRAANVMDYYEHALKNGKVHGPKGGLSVRSVKSHGLVLKQALNEAVLRELIPKNPAIGIPIPKRESQAKEYAFLNAEEANRLLQCLNGHPLQEMVFVALYYGLRRSEALGLKWNALDFEKDSLSIQHTIVKNVTIVAKDKTKTATSRGSYRLLPEIKDVLLAIRRRQKENRLLFGKEYILSDYVFTWPNGKLFHPCYVTRGFQRALKNAGLPKMRFHDLRHSTASILYDKGWGMKDIQEWLRHADIETTGNIYTHIHKQRKEHLSNDLSGTLKLAL